MPVSVIIEAVKWEHNIQIVQELCLEDIYSVTPSLLSNRSQASTIVRSQPMPNEIQPE